MTHLPHVSARAAPPAPAPIAVVVDAGVDWLVAQVRAEFQELFPEARIEVNPTTAAELLVVVHPTGTQPEDALARVDERVRYPRIGVGLYCVDERRLELVAAGDVDRWQARRRRRRLTLAWSRRVPFLWNRVVRRLVAP
jgi:hypothetical protein